MFSVRYLMLDDEIERIREIKSISDFENDIDTVVGQIQLSFTNNSIGFVDEDIPYNGEFIVTWLRLLNEAVVFLEEYGFATIHEPDSDNIWLEFQKSEEELSVKRAKVDKQKLVLSHIEKLPKNYVEVFWKDKVSKREFYNSIQKVTNDFLVEISKVNPLIKQSNDLQKLEKAYTEAIVCNGINVGGVWKSPVKNRKNKVYLHRHLKFLELG